MSDLGPALRVIRPLAYLHWTVSPTDLVQVTAAIDENAIYIDKVVTITSPELATNVSLQQVTATP